LDVLFLWTIAVIFAFVVKIWKHARV